MTRDVVVVGAGVSGLACAGALRAIGLEPLVLERARGVGGRCATRRVEGRPVDHGVPFLHGRDPGFVAALESVEGVTQLPGWPRVRDGTGRPCQPEAFDGRDVLLAYREGVSAFAKHLARDLDVRLNSRVVSLLRAGRAPGAAGGSIALALESGEPVETRALVLTMPVPRALELLGTLDPASERVAAVRPLLELVRTVPCLTVIARYPEAVCPPRWDASYPGNCAVVHVVLHDSSKRGAEGPVVLVIQALPRFSRQHLDEPAEAWSKTVLSRAAELHGEWIERPSLAQAHVWHHARVMRGSELAAPLALTLEDGAVLGLCGDGFSPAAGLEGAYRSGLALASALHGRMRLGLHA